jgi:hypothetical protein
MTRQPSGLSQAQLLRAALICLLASLSLLWAATAGAQPLFRAGLVANLAAQAADGVTTWQALQRPGTYEANPAMRWVAQSPVRLTAAKVVSATAQTYLLRRLHRTHPKWATGLAWGLAGVVGTVAWRNHAQGRTR